MILFSLSDSWSDLTFANSQWMVAASLVGIALVLLSILSYRNSTMPAAWKGIGILLRTMGIGILLLCLLEPMASMQRPKPQANVFATIVDRSKSVDILLREKLSAIGKTSLDEFRDEAEWQRKLADDFRVRRYTLDGTLEPVDTLEGIRFDGNASAIYSSLTTLGERYQGRPLAGVILFSDGQSTETRPERSLSELGFPVYPVNMGKVKSKPDLRIVSASTRQSDFETSPVTLSAQLTHTGLEGGSVVVDLIDSEQKTVQSQTIQLQKENEAVPVEFRFRPRGAGVHSYRLSARTATEHPTAETRVAESTTTELTLGNNTKYQVVDRGHGPYRILYLGGRPNWEYKFLKRSLDEDDEIRMTALIRIAKKEMKFNFRDSKIDASNPLFSGFDDVTQEEKEQFDEAVFARLGRTSVQELMRGFPKDASELFEYQAILIDDIEHEFLNAEQQTLLRQFVAIRGGGLLIMGGQESMRGKGYKDSVLGQLAPIYPEDNSSKSSAKQGDLFDVSSAPSYKYQLTREGWLQPFLRLAEGEPAEKARLDAMPPFEVMNRVKGIKPGASTFAEAIEDKDSKVPVLVTQRFGKGRTAALMIGDMWKWAMHHSGADASPLQQSWRQMIRWLIADVPKSIEMKRDPTVNSSRSAKILVDVKGSDFKTIDNARVSVKVSLPSGKTVDSNAEGSSKVAGQYETVVVMDEEGVYSATAEVLGQDGVMLGTSQMGWVHEPSALEFQEIGGDRAVLETIAKETGGEVIELEDLASFVQDLPSRKVPVTETKIYPLWHQGWVLMAALSCICIEWGMRRRYGLV